MVTRRRRFLKRSASTLIMRASVKEEAIIRNIARSPKRRKIVTMGSSKSRVKRSVVSAEADEEAEAVVAVSREAIVTIITAAVSTEVPKRKPVKPKSSPRIQPLKQLHRR